MTDQRGFTLLEVLVALAVFALLSATVVSAFGYVVSRQSGFQDRLLAAWLADNHLTELSLSPPKDIAQPLIRRMDARDWVVREAWGDTDDAGLAWIEVSVTLKGTPQVLASSSSRLRVSGHER